MTQITDAKMYQFPFCNSEERSKLRLLFYYTKIRKNYEQDKYATYEFKFRYKTDI